MAVIALDLGGTKLSGALFSDSGEVLHRRVNLLPAEKGDSVMALIEHMVAEIRSVSSDHSVDSIGICVPGIYHVDTGCVWAPNIEGWEDFPLRDRLETISGDARVFVDSDRACCILGEVWQGAARQCSDAIFLTVGTGIGAGILIRGEVLRGAHDIAGAIGWMALDRPYKAEYKQCGCFEHYASGDGIAKTAEEVIRRSSDNGGLAALSRGELNAQRVFQAYARRDPLAVETMSQVVQFWGMATANLVSLFNPEKIVFGGGVFGPATAFLPQIREEALKWAQPISMQRVELTASQLASDASLYGAAYLALKVNEEATYGKKI